jgi:hypothetical protein
MSNAKWRKLFVALERAGIAIPVSRWKYVGDPQWREVRHLPVESDLESEGLRDGRFPPVRFRDIEEIQIPRGDVTDSQARFELIAKVLAAAGQFPVTVGQDCLSIRAYET